MAKDLKLQVLIDAKENISGMFKGVSGALKKTSKELNALKKTQSEVGKFTELKTGLNSTKKAWGEASKKVAQLKNELNKIDQPTKKMRTEFNKAVKTAGKLKNKFNEEQIAVQALRKELKNTGIDTKNLIAHNKKLSQSIATLNNKYDKQKAKLSRLNKINQQKRRFMTNHKRRMEGHANLSFVGGAGVATGLGIKAGAQSFFGGFLEFDQAMSKVQALTRLDKTSKQLAELRNQAKKLGAETSFTATEVAGGQGFLAMAGFDPNEIKAAMPSMLDLAKGADVDLASTSDIASNILSAFKLEASEMTRVSDTLAGTFSRSNVDLRMLGDTMKYVAPIAMKAGASMEDVAAMTGLLGNIGIQGSNAGTALRSMYNRMTAPPKEAAKALKKLKITTTDANNNLRPMTEILAEVAKKTKNLGSAKQLEYFKAIAGARAGAAMSEMVDKGGAGELQKFIEILMNTQGEARKIHEVMEDNATGDLLKLKSAWDGLATAVGETNNKGFRGAIQSLTQMVGKIKEWGQQNPELVATIVKVTAVVGSLAFAGGALALTISGIAGPVLGVIKVLNLLKFAVMTNPILLALGGIAAAVYLIYKNWDWLKQKWNEMWTAIGNFISTAWTKIKTITSLAWEGIKKLFFNWHPLGVIIQNWTPLLQWFQRLPEKFIGFGKSIIAGIVAGIKAGWGELVKLLKSILDLVPSMADIKEKVGGMWDAGKNAAAGLAKGVSDNAGSAWNSAKNMAEGAVNSVSSSLGIKSPSRVFEGLGLHTVAGFAKGLGQHAAPLQQLMTLGQRLKSQAKTIAIAGGISAPMIAGAAGGFNPAGGSLSAPGQTGAAPVININITINAAPGMNERQLAEQVGAKVQEAMARPTIGFGAFFDEE